MPLNAKQLEMLPAIQWLFTPHKNMGEGKSYVLAWHCVDLVIQGYDIVLNNPSFVRGENGIQSDRAFASLVLRLAEERYPEFLFYFNAHSFVFRLQGTRDASIPSGAPGTITSKVS